jgi:phenylpropionate dioxygenase-like ring-hydroxylating dioxygenase large terminal subunit
MIFNINILFFLIGLQTLQSFYINPFTSIRKIIKQDNTRMNPSTTQSDTLIKMNANDSNISEQMRYDLQWYVIGVPSDFSKRVPKKVRVWNKDYAVWKGDDGFFRATQNECSHKGASLSGGKIINDKILCPYHGYEFAKNGTLIKVPGICFKHSPIHDILSYPVVEKNGWVYLNTYERNSETRDIMFHENIYNEPEASSNFTSVHLELNFNCYSRILSENSLDVMHIGFVHTFGNRINPAPIVENPPHKVGDYHYKTSYNYESGGDSMARRIFGAKELVIENEFILPHTTVARVIFGNFVSTVITFALPLGNDKSILYVKTYRNFWLNPFGDTVIYNMMFDTMNQDKAVVENINPTCMDGKFNMKYDKLQNVYKTFYRKFVHKMD